MNNKYMLSFLKKLLPKFEALESTVSIIIQGPLHHRSIDSIESYLRYGEVIVSCWDTDDLSKLEKYNDKIKIVVNKYSDLGYHYRLRGSQAPWLYQNYTTLNGLKEASGYFSIKFRSDESYPIIDPIINKLNKIHHEQKNPKTNDYDYHKLLTSNIYFRRDNENKFHPSDHIVAGATLRMITVYEKACNISKFGTGGQRFPEQVLCKAAIESRIIKGKGFFEKDRFDTMRELDSKDQMKEYFDIIRICELPDHIWTSSYRRYDALRAEEDWCHDINSI